MTPDTPTATPAPAKPKRTQGDLDKRLLADIQLGEDIADAAADPDHAPQLAAEDVDAAAVTHLASLAAEARDLAAQTVAAKKLRETATRTEDTARKILLAALRDLQNRAKRKFPKDKPRQAAYGIGKKNFGSNRNGLEQDADNLIQLAGPDALPGLKPAKLAAAGTALTTWKKADTDQAKASEDQGKLLTALEIKVGEINAVRRDIQLAANSAWPPTDPASAATRRLFKIPARKPMVE